ncbi:MAG: penicillin-binding protein [Pirellulaceae bacterium]|nr:MAG: penicillin-binding protein [Pirellulaceae bacterium]
MEKFFPHHRLPDYHMTGHELHLRTINTTGQNGMLSAYMSTTWMVIATLCTGVGAEAAPPGPAKEQEPWLTAARQIVEPLIEEEIMAISIGLIDNDRKLSLHFGKLSRTSTTIPNDDTIYEIGSITKTFTALLLADLVVRQELRLEEDIIQYLPDGEPVPMCADHPVRWVDLATHTSGLPRLPGNLLIKDPLNPYKGYTVEMLEKAVADHARLSNLRRGLYSLGRTQAPEYHYSNFGFGLLGHLLAKHTGKSYEQLLIERITEPLAMHDTRVTLTAEQQSRLAPGHNADLDPVPGWELDAMVGAGGVRSTIRDMLRYAEANLGSQPTPLDAAVTLTHQPRVPFPNGKVGLGWHITEGIWHNGMTGGYASFLWLEPDEHRAVVVLANTASPYVDAVGLALKDCLRGRPPRPVPRRPVYHVPPAVLDSYVGQYQLLLSRLVISRDQRSLRARLGNQPALRIYPASDREFFYKMVDARITFDCDECGKVKGLTLHQNGLKLYFTRRP